MPHDFFKRNGFRIIFVVVFLLAFVWMGTKRTFLSNSNAVEDWLPDHYQETRDYKWFLENFPFESFIVVSWNGCTLSDDRIEMFAQKLVPSQTIENFSLAVNEPSVKATLDLGGASAVETTAGEPSEPKGSSAPEAKKTPSEEYFRSVMTGPRLVRLLEETAGRTLSDGSPEELHEKIVDKLRGTLIGSDGESTAMIVTLNTGFKGGGKKMQQVIDRIKAISVECGLPDTTAVKSGSVASRAVHAVVSTLREIVEGRHPRMDALILGGPPVDNAALDREGTQTLFRLAGFCAAISVTLAILCLKDIRLTMFVFWTSILSAGVALALVSFTGGKCDSILLSMPALIYVLAMSGSIHMVNYWQDAVRERGIDNAAERAVSHAFSPCFFAQLTTAIGLGSLVAGKLVPITNFGIYSALGVMTTLLLLFFYLPALLNAFPCRKFVSRYAGCGMDAPESGIHLFWQRFGKVVVRYHNLVAILCFAAMFFFGFWLPKIKTSVKMMNFFSDDAEIIAHYGFLEEKLGPLVPMELVLRFDNAKVPTENDSVSRLQIVRTLGETLQAKLPDEIGGVMSAALFLPNPDTLRRPGTLAHRIASKAVGQNIESNRENLNDYLSVEGNPSLGAIETFLRERSAAAANDESADVRRQLETLTEHRAFLAENGVVDLKTLTGRLHAGEAFRTLSGRQTTDLCDACRLWQHERGTELWRMSIRVWALKRDIDYSVFIQNVRGVVEPYLETVNAEIVGHAVDGGTNDAKAVSAVYTGMVPLVYKTQHALIQGLTGSLVTAFGLITMVMIILLRSVGAGLVAMLPNIFPVIVVFGFMAWLQLPVDVGTMMTASIALGVAIDDTLHYLTWYQEGIKKGQSPAEATEWGYRRCAKAMTESSLIAGLGLSAFMLSTFVPTQRFGLLMLATLFAAEVGDLVFLPALLTGPLGRFFLLKRKKNPTRAVPVSPSHGSDRETACTAETSIYPIYSASEAVKRKGNRAVRIGQK